MPGWVLPGEVEQSATGDAGVASTSMEPASATSAATVTDPRNCGLQH